MIQFLKNRFYVIFWILFLLIIIIFYIHSHFALEKLVNNPRYTVAVITSNWHYKNNNGSGVDYSFSIENQVYNYTFNFKAEKGDKFLIMYDENNKGTFCILPFYPLPKTITSPQNGWRQKEVPIPIDTIKIREYLENL